MVTADYFGRQVEILSLFEGGTFPWMATVRLLNGSTVTRMTHGGPAEYNQFSTRLDMLSDVKSDKLVVGFSEKQVSLGVQASLVALYLIADMLSY